MDNLLALLTALGGLTGLAGLVSALAAARNAAKLSDLQALRDTIAALEAENSRLRACIEALEVERGGESAERRERHSLGDRGNEEKAGQLLGRLGK